MPRIHLDGVPIEAQAEDTVAAALLRAGVTTFTRSIKYHRPRGPFCFAGSCGQCLMRIDGLPSLPACRVPVAEGMRCERQNAFPSADVDLLHAADWLSKLSAFGRNRLAVPPKQTNSLLYASNFSCSFSSAQTWRTCFSVVRILPTERRSVSLSFSLV